MEPDFVSTRIEPEVLKRLVRPQLANMTPEAARAVLELRLDDQDRARIHELSEKAQRSRLSRAEEEELEFYLRLGRVVELLWSKARQSLKKAGVDLATSRDA